MSLLRGPLVMALRIGECMEQIGGQAPHADWAVHPTTPWNYGLFLGSDATSSDTVEAPVSPVPFAADAPARRDKAPRVPFARLGFGERFGPFAFAGTIRAAAQRPRGNH